MSGTLFEKNVAKSIRDFNTLTGTHVTNQIILNTFFENKMAKMIPSYSGHTLGKQAIVLLGQSCCGKTSFADSFVEEHPEFKVLSMDECAHRHIQTLTIDDLNLLSKIFGETVADHLGNTIFGNEIANGEKLIIDGCWLHVNARSALLKTLHAFGYHICIFSFLTIPKDAFEVRVVHRAFHTLANRILKVDLLSSPWKFDSVAAFAEKENIPLLEAECVLLRHPDFKQIYQDQLKYLQEELQGSLLNEQIECGWIYMGAEEFMNVTF